MSKLNHLSGSGSSYGLNELIKEYNSMKPIIKIMDVDVNDDEMCNGIMSERKADEFASTTE
jgi:hypothetical protein